MKKILTIVAIVFGAMNVYAQDEVETTIGADVVSKYIWRGQDCGHASIQPTLGIAYKGLSLTSWGSVGIVDSNDAEELDFTLAYTVGGLTVGVTDYWFSGGSNKYFNYKKNETAHVFEANVGYDFGAASINWYTNFAGNDGLNKDGKRAYSSYVELAAPFKLGGCDWKAAIGAVPFATSYYSDANGFAITNIALTASKDLHVTDSFTVPVFAGLAANPSNEKLYFNVGFSLQLQ